MSRKHDKSKQADEGAAVEKDVTEEEREAEREGQEAQREEREAEHEGISQDSMESARLAGKRAEDAVAAAERSQEAEEEKG